MLLPEKLLFMVTVYAVLQGPLAWFVCLLAAVAAGEQWIVKRADRVRRR